MKKVLLAILILLVLFAGWIFSLSQKLPTTEGNADELVQAMLKSLNVEAYQNLQSISWTYRGKHHYRWEKAKSRVKVTLPDVEAMLNFGTGGHQVIASELPEQEAIDKAIANFFNDSFWLVAPFKILDKGTTRGYVQTADGPGILVTYASGGVTPGDSYLWVLDENHRPKYWRIWTSVVPVPGLKFEWTNWQQHKGVWFATTHPGPGPVSIEITNLKVE